MAAGRDVFVDTSGLYALVDKNDAHHAAARETVAKIVRAGRQLIVTDYVVDETVTLAHAQNGAQMWHFAPCGEQVGPDPQYGTAY